MDRKDEGGGVGSERACGSGRVSHWQVRVGHGMSFALEP